MARKLRACGQYVEYNPVKAGLVNRVQDWRYSSGQYYFEGKPDELLDRYELSQTMNGVNISSEEFEQGHGIGSDYFNSFGQTVYEITNMPMKLR